MYTVCMKLAHDMRLYHIIQYGQIGVFETPIQKVCLISLFDAYSKHYRVSINAFSILENQFHLLVYASKHSILSFIDTVKIMFCRVYMDVKHKPQFYSDIAGVFKEPLIIWVKNVTYYLPLCRYIHLLEGKEKKLYNIYPWSSFLDYSTGTHMYPWLSKNYHTSDPHSFAVYTLKGNDRDFETDHIQAMVEGVLE